MFKAARAAFENVDPQCEDAARTLGLSEWSIFLRVSLPLAWRGILAGLLLAFARLYRDSEMAVLTAADIPGRNDCGPLIHDDPILAQGHVHYLGQPVFVVIATDRELARRAHQHVERFRRLRWGHARCGPGG